MIWSRGSLPPPAPSRDLRKHGKKDFGGGVGTTGPVGAVAGVGDWVGVVALVALALVKVKEIGARPKSGEEREGPCRDDGDRIHDEARPNLGPTLNATASHKHSMKDAGWQGSDVKKVADPQRTKEGEGVDG
ncbi:hypothetical protein ACHAWF_015270 [Thalassiosira exigua]